MCDLDYYRRDLDKNAINALPMIAYEGPVHLVRTEADLRNALSLLRNETLVGFDTETRPSFEKGQLNPTALLQMAGSNCVVLIRLAHVPLEPLLTDFLANPVTVKAGVAIREDMRMLQRNCDFCAASLADLGDMARRIGLKTQGLRTLAANLMGVRISKGAQCSNWEKSELTEAQIRYAATDAWIGRELYTHLYRLAQCS